eukprot:TRINITY_DN1885_c0_g2_i2.p3 TRINITY_DN1885_c0_g2~~TRINITY_DN1885_c0_g2_i2.p3  ORF type:complete len:303 (-),score=23.81 TRINITY_DN1885_c0_g2_i2:1593-2501(-)
MAITQTLRIQINLKTYLPNEHIICRPLKSVKRNYLGIIKCQSVGSRDGGFASPHPVVMADYKEQDDKLNQISQLKNRLLREVVGLDRGLAATGSQPQIIDGLVRELTDMEGKVNLNWKTSVEHQNYSTMDELQGVWRLAYTSAFTTGSLGGSRVGPPASIFPLILGSIYQVINNEMSQLDNVVEFFFNYSLPFTPQFSTPVIRASLKHSFEIEGDSTVRIVFKSTDVNVIGEGFFDTLPTFELPEIPQFFQSQLRSATFEVVYLDDDIRITRGDRGELRIYARCFENSLLPTKSNLSSVDDD